MLLLDVPDCRFICPEDLVLDHQEAPWDPDEHGDSASALEYATSKTLDRIHADWSDDPAWLLGKLLPLVDLATRLRQDKLLPKLSEMMGTISLMAKEWTGSHPAALFDGLYVLIGVTPENEGIEICSLVEQFKAQDLEFPPQAVAELKFMNDRVYKEVLAKAKTMPQDTDAIQRLTQNMNKICSNLEKQGSFQRSAASRFLSDSINFGFIRGEQTYATHEEFLHDEDSAGGSTFDLSPPLKVNSAEPSGVASMDVIKVPRASAGTAKSEIPMFFNTSSRKTADQSADNESMLLRAAFSSTSKEPNLISARSLFDVQTKPLYSVLRVKAGLQPLIRRPEESSFLRLTTLDGDLERQEKEKQEKERREKALQETGKEADYSINTIEAVFSNNGQAWNYIDHRSAGTTVIGKGFYLTKAAEGKWVLILGTCNEESADELTSSKLSLFRILNTSEFLSLAPDVMQILKSAVWLSWCLFMRKKTKATRKEKKAAMSEDDDDSTNDGCSLAGQNAEEPAVAMSEGADGSTDDGGSLAGQNAEVTVPGSTTCNVCNLVFQSRSLMVKHIRATHPETIQEANMDEADNSRGREGTPDIASAGGWTDDDWKHPPKEGRLAEVLQELRLCLKQDTARYKEYMGCEDIIVQRLQQVLDKIREKGRGDVWKAMSKPKSESEPDLDVWLRDARKGVKMHEHAPLNELRRQLDVILTKEDARSRTNLHSILTLAKHAADGENRVRLERVKSVGGGMKKPDIHQITSAVELEEFQQQISHHHTITKMQFRIDSYNIVNRMKVKDPKLRGTKFLRYDSDSDDEDTVTQRLNQLNQKTNTDGDKNRYPMGRDPSKSNSPAKLKSKHTTESQGAEKGYCDDKLDRGCIESKQRSVFPSVGFGAPSFNTMTVLSHLDDDVPVYFLVLDHTRLKMQYDSAEGIPIAFLVHKDAIHGLLKEHERQVEEQWELVSNAKDKPKESCSEWSAREMSNLRSRLLDWIVDLLRSPLPEHDKQWMLGIMGCGDEPLMRPPAQLKVKGDHVLLVNLTIIAKCLCEAFPTMHVTKHTRARLCKAWELKQEVEPFIQRKGRYGIYIVKGGTLDKLRGHGIECHEIFESDATKSQNDNLKYLDIIDLFSDYCCIVYVRGLRRISDKLLKWLAEYTHAHPWRFVYLENTDVSWNFSENRDRCNFTHAPELAAHMIRSPKDLDTPDVKGSRPHHEHDYGQQELPASDRTDWDKLTAFWFKFAKPDMSNDESPSNDESNDESSMSKFFKRLDDSNCGDFSEDLNRTFKKPDPCLLLLHSPPGAGKTYHVEGLKDAVLNDPHLNIKYERIDGSSDQLVTAALSDLLEKAVPDASGSDVMLVIDEYHMLSDNQKQEFFLWLRDKIDRMHILLIANRVDDFDFKQMEKFKQLLPEDRFKKISGRLTEKKIREVIETKKLGNGHEILLWMRCCRLLFGDEAISLRSLESLADIFSKPDFKHAKLKDHILNKVPTISQVTGEEFASAFLEELKWVTPENEGTASMLSPRVSSASTTRGPARSGPIHVLLAIAIRHTRDCACSFPELASKLGGAYQVPPALRLAGWCTVMKVNHAEEWPGGADSAGQQHGLDATGAGALFKSDFVDQVGFPLQLNTKPMSDPWKGLAFSWSGDFENLLDIIDALNHNHTVDWKKVGACWKDHPVEDTATLVRLVSTCKSQKDCLKALSERNLCDLLDRAAPKDAASLALTIVMHFKDKVDRNPSKCKEQCSRFHMAVWTLIRFCNIDEDEERGMASHVELFWDKLGFPKDKDKDEDEDEKREKFDMVFESLMWAKENAGTEGRLSIDNNAMAATELLCTLLRCVSEDLVTRLKNDCAKACKEKIGDLWMGLFASLLVPESDPDEEEMIRQPIEVVQLAVEANEDESKWPQEVGQLWSVCHQRADSATVEELWMYNRFLLYDTNAAKGASLPPIKKEFVAGIFRAERIDPVDLQIHILQSASYIPENEVSKEKLTRGLDACRKTEEPLKFHKDINPDFQQELTGILQGE